MLIHINSYTATVHTVLAYGSRMSPLSDLSLLDILFHNAAYNVASLLRPPRVQDVLAAKRCGHSKYEEIYVSLQLLV